MSQYDDMYVKTERDPTFWAVDHGERRKMNYAHEVNADPREVVVITQAELDAIPLEGEGKAEPEPEPPEVDEIDYEDCD